MNKDDLYKKIQWIYDMPKIFKDNVLFDGRLDSLQKEEQEELMQMIIYTLSKAFSQPVDEIEDIELSVWTNGACDLRIVQIINGLLDILNLKTEYQKWPPKSVMQFYAVCKNSRSTYNEQKNNNLISLKPETRESKKKKIEIINDIFKKLGRNYRLFLNNQISNIEDKRNKTEKDIIIYNKSKESLEILNEIEKNTNA